MKIERQRWSWYLSAVVYRRAYIRLAHQLDQDLFAYLGERVQRARVADCGCGPGIVTEKFVKAGAALVLAIDQNPLMIHQTRRRLATPITAGRVRVMQRPFESTLFPEINRRFLDHQGLDIILFKRSLYLKREKALPVLQAAVATLRQGGVLAMIHGERSVRRYAFDARLRPTHYTLLHLINRTLSKLGEKLGFGPYAVYTEAELLDLLQAAAPGYRVEHIPSQQSAYNLAAVLN